jgi:transposase
MSLYAGLDISVKTTAVCVVNGNGQVLLETVVESSPDAIADRLRELGQPPERIGLEAGPLSQWIYAGLIDIGLAPVCVETDTCTQSFPRGSIRLIATTPVGSPR